MKQLDLKKQPDLLHSILNLPFNTYFAQAVLKEDGKGAVYSHENGFYLTSDYGMALLFGKPSPNFIQKLYLHLDQKKVPHFIQAADFACQEVLDHYCSQRKIAVQHRMNFTFQSALFEGSKLPQQNASIAIEKLTEKDFNTLTGTVIPAYFWKDASHFLKKGKGFKLLEKGKIAAIAFSSYAGEDKTLEIGIETFEPFQKRGYGKIISSHLITACLKEGILPVWSCKVENRSSYRLAKSLGFIPALRLPYYCI